MELLNIASSKVTEVTYTLQDNLSAFYYIKRMDDSGEVIDHILKDKDGYEIDDPVLLEEVQNFFNHLKKIK